MTRAHPGETFALVDDTERLMTFDKNQVGRIRANGRVASLHCESGISQPGIRQPYAKLRVNNIGVVAMITPVDVSTNVQMGAEVRFYDNNSLSRKLFNCMMQSVGGK